MCPNTHADWIGDANCPTPASNILWLSSQPSFFGHPHNNETSNGDKWRMLWGPTSSEMTVKAPKSPCSFSLLSANDGLHPQLQFWHWLPHECSAVGSWSCLSTICLAMPGLHRLNMLCSCSVRRSSAICCSDNLTQPGNKLLMVGLGLISGKGLKVIFPKLPCINTHHQRFLAAGHIAAKSIMVSLRSHLVNDMWYSRHFCTNPDVAAPVTHSRTTRSFCNKYAAKRPYGSVCALSSAPCFWSPNLEKGWQLNPHAIAPAWGAASWILTKVANLHKSPWITVVFPNCCKWPQKDCCNSFWAVICHPA